MAEPGARVEPFPLDDPGYLRPCPPGAPRPRPIAQRGQEVARRNIIALQPFDMLQRDPPGEAVHARSVLG